MKQGAEKIEVYTEKEIADRIHVIRGQKVMLDRDLAELYGTPAKVLNQAVKRNLKRFPPDFMFKLNSKELSGSRSQNVTLNRGQNIKYLPSAFTENGVAMLSSVLNSERAIQVNIQIMRAFTRNHKVEAHLEDLLEKIKLLEHQTAGHTMRFDAVFSAIHFLLDQTKKK